MAEQVSQTILVVEDSENWLSMNQRMLELLGANVLTASSLATARELLEKGGITHIVTDGLQGDWRGVLQAAQEVEINFGVVLSADDIEDDVRSVGATYVDKKDIISGAIEYEDLIK